MASEDTAPFTGTRLLGVVLVELLGIAIVGFGLVELYILGGNPFRPTTLIPLGSLVMAFGSMWFAKIYSGPRVFAYARSDEMQGRHEDWVKIAVFGTVLLFALIGFVASVFVVFG